MSVSGLDERYMKPWESSSHEDSGSRPRLQTVDSMSESEHAQSPSPQPRSSHDSVGRSSASLWHEAEADHSSTIGAAETLVEASFDENVLRALCELDCGVPLLLDRIKQSMVSCREASVFFKKRAVIEEEYAKSMQKLARSTVEVYAMNDGKAGSFSSAWKESMTIHDSMGDNRLRFAHRLNEMSEELASLAKEVDKNRKQTKDVSTRYERALQESEALTEKCKTRLEITSEELERLLLQKEGESVKDSTVQGRSPGAAGGKRAIGKAVAKGGLLLKGKNPGNILRQEDDIRSRMSLASDAYRKAVTETQATRQEYFNFQLPRTLRSLKECADEIDLGVQYHLTRYAFLFESIILSDGSTLMPDEGPTAKPGLKATIESIDNRSDFKIYMQHYQYARGNAHPRGPRREGPSDEGFLPPLATHGGGNSDRGNTPTHSATPNSANSLSDKGRPTFGVDLAEQMARDDVEVPLIMVKCCQAIEKYGLGLTGIYRLSGTTSKVAKLRQRLDKDIDSVDLDAPEWSMDINNVTSVMKMWLRELPDPLLTFALHEGFVSAAKIENDRLRHIRLHERVNDLPDPNYATLKYFLGHLYRINQNAEENSMSMQNLSIVFGPTLFGQPAASSATPTSTGSMADAGYQNQAIETILNHYTDIFVDEVE